MNIIPNTGSDCEVIIHCYKKIWYFSYFTVTRWCLCFYPYMIKNTREHFYCERYLWYSSTIYYYGR